MKAYVINQEQLSKYISISVAALIVSFVLGYYMGSSISETDVEPSVEVIEQLPLDADEAEKTEVDEATALAKQQNTSSSVSDNKNKNSEVKTTVKKPDIKSDVKKAEIKKTVKATTENKPSAKEVANIVKEKKSIAEKSVTVKPVEPVNASKSEEKGHSSQPQTSADNSKQNDAVVKKEQASTVTEQNDNTSANRVYSIQAGMFASKTNALSFIEKLTQQNFDAYVIDFVSGSGAVKYNVRVGHFSERETAREKLKEYQKSFSTPAYVVIAQ